MEIRISREQFENLKDLIRICEEHDGTGIILSNKRKRPQFERYYPKENK